MSSLRTGTDFLAVDDATIVVTTSPGNVGPADIVVLDPAGDGGLVGGVSYIAPSLSASGGLPRTGTTTWTSAVAASISIVVGLALYTISRRRLRHRRVREDTAREPAVSRNAVA